MTDRGPRQEQESQRRLPDPAHLPAGFVIGGKYQIKRLLGEGSNGSVYEGEHSQIGHRVAIKVVHKDLAEREDIIARFQREARICGTIRNRHVGQVYDVGELPGGAPFMVMELHEGGSLAQLLQGGPLPIKTAVDLGRQLLLALQAAHDIGVVHRDVKPDNVMLVQEAGGHALLKLVDFGIGKTLSLDLSSRAVTLEGMVVGSPDYMPPEQLKGEPVDHRADLYAAGVVLYEMITGRVPFDAASLTELFVAILRDPLIPLRQLRPDCPAELEAIVLRALSRDAADRCASALEMERQLAQLERDQVLGTSAPPRNVEAAGRSSSRSQLRRVAARADNASLRPSPNVLTRLRSRPRMLAAGLLSVAGLATVLLFWSRADQNAGELVDAARRSSAGTPPGEVWQARPAPVPGAVPEAVRALPPAETVAQESRPGAPAAATPAPPAVRRKRADATPEREAKAERRSTKAARTPAATGAASARPSATSAGEVVVEEPTSLVVAPSPSELVRDASAAFVRGQMPRARALYREAIKRSPDNADAWRGLGMVSSRMGERDEAALAFRRYLQLRPSASDAAAIRRKLNDL